MTVVLSLHHATQVYGEPVALDYNKDMIIDLFGLQHNNTDRTFWVFNKERLAPTVTKMIVPKHIATDSALSIPHAHAYLDLNNDFTADLFISAENHFEVWHGLEHDGFEFSKQVKLPIGQYGSVVGQTLFMDVELNGNITQVLPYCFNPTCKSSAILVHAGNEFHNLNINFKDTNNVEWGFVVPDHQQLYQRTITMRAGDFNMDGYPDLLVTLKKTAGGQPQTFFMKNVECRERMCAPLSRRFEVQWDTLAPFSNGTITGAFYDFYQDGILDVLMVERKGNSDQYRLVAFRNTLDYDANFVKVIVLTGLTNSRSPTKLTPLGHKKRTYGTNLPGPRIAYYTTTQDGAIQHGSSVQIPQSAYFSLHLPYTIFGLGRTPNFVDSLTVGLSNRSRTWFQLIPNSQMIVVPWPPEEPIRWKAQLFVTPSKLIWMSVVALGSTCLIILFIIMGLYFKEKREDKLERQLAAHRFHFDAM